MEQIFDRITIDPEVLGGKPAFRHKRIAVETILEFLSAGESTEEILRQYPSLEKGDIRAALEFATELMKHNYTIRLAA
jgi:uncharacterized protein (DUF433 family)